MKRIFAVLALSLPSMLGFMLGAMTCQMTMAQEPKAHQPKAQESVPEVTNEKPMSFWMAQKIELSKKILESLTKEDFKTLESDATQLRTLGKIEGFVRRQDGAYRRYQQQFDSALLDVANQARAHNVEGATLAFNQLTTSCVACHKRLRQQPEPAEVTPAPAKP